MASTFAKQETGPRRSKEERPSFRSVANAIRTGIFIEKIYRRMSSSQLMVFPPEVQHVLKVIYKIHIINVCIYKKEKMTWRILVLYTVWKKVQFEESRACCLPQVIKWTWFLIFFRKERTWKGLGSPENFQKSWFLVLEVIEQQLVHTFSIALIF